MVNHSHYFCHDLNKLLLLLLIMAILIFVNNKKGRKTCANRAPVLKHPLPFCLLSFSLSFHDFIGSIGDHYILVKSQSGINMLPENNQMNLALLYLSLLPVEVLYKPQTWNTALLKIFSSGLVRITFFPLHRRVLNQEPYRSYPSDRVPRGWVTRFSAPQRFQRNFFGKISFNESDGVATQTLFMLAIIFRYHWYKTVLNTCWNGTKWCNVEFGRLPSGLRVPRIPTDPDPDPFLPCW